jgi:tRNA threonylcarbamoyl adenosine modification protein (Sua5/YciO/YrdC/YwlC family)
LFVLSSKTESVPLQKKILMFVEINPKNMDNRLIKQAVQCLKNGELIIFPTDTVYAVGCDLRNKKALKELANWKDLKLNKTKFSIICHDLSQITEYVKQLDRITFRLLKHYLPGPFTCILDATNEVSKLFEASKKEIGIRMPDNAIVLAIVEELGNPIATTSLHDNEDEITDYFIDPSALYERYDETVGMIIDGGYGNIEGSTVVDCTGGGFEIIRQGLGTIEL